MAPISQLLQEALVAEEVDQRDAPAAARARTAAAAPARIEQALARHASCGSAHRRRRRRAAPRSRSTAPRPRRCCRARRTAPASRSSGRSWRGRRSAPSASWKLFDSSVAQRQRDGEQQDEPRATSSMPPARVDAGFARGRPDAAAPCRARRLMALSSCAARRRRAASRAAARSVSGWPSRDAEVAHQRWRRSRRGSRRSGAASGVEPRAAEGAEEIEQLRP